MRRGGKREDDGARLRYGYQLETDARQSGRGGEGRSDTARHAA